MSRSPNVLRRRRKPARRRCHGIQRFVNYVAPAMTESFMELAFNEPLFPRLIYRPSEK